MRGAERGQVEGGRVGKGKGSVYGERERGGTRGGGGAKECKERKVGLISLGGDREGAKENREDRGRGSWEGRKVEGRGERGVGGSRKV